LIKGGKQKPLQFTVGVGVGVGVEQTQFVLLVQALLRHLCELQTKPPVQVELE
jgi:hypothetical protein